MVSAIGALPSWRIPIAPLERPSTAAFNTLTGVTDGREKFRCARGDTWELTEVGVDRGRHGPRLRGVESTGHRQRERDDSERRAGHRQRELALERLPALDILPGQSVTAEPGEPRTDRRTVRRIRIDLATRAELGAGNLHREEIAACRGEPQPGGRRVRVDREHGRLLAACAPSTPERRAWPDPTRQSRSSPDSAAGPRRCRAARPRDRPEAVTARCRRSGR